MSLRLSREGAGMTAGFEACILEGYADPGTGGEPWTIGVGHTTPAGPPRVRKGDIISLARAFEIFRADMAKFENGVSAAVKRPLKQHEFDALVSFHFNTGAIKTGSVDDKLNRGDVDGALATLGQYVNAGGKRLNGLVTRRRAETEVFRTGRYPAARILVKDRVKSQGRYISVADMPWGDDVKPVIALDTRTAPIVTSPVQPKKTWLQTIWSWFS